MYFLDFVSPKLLRLQKGWCTIHKGIDSKVEVNISQNLTLVSGLANWSYAGETRETMEEIEFGTDHAQQESGLERGGAIECSGFFRLDEDAGQQFLQDCFDNSVKLYNEDIRFYVDDTHYLTPDDTSDPESYITITKCKAIGQSASGTATFAFSAICSGKMKVV